MAKNSYVHSDDIRVALGTTVKRKNKEMLQNIANSQRITIGKLAGLILENKLIELQKEGKLDDLDNLRLTDLFDLESLI